MMALGALAIPALLGITWYLNGFITALEKPAILRKEKITDREFESELRFNQWLTGWVPPADSAVAGYSTEIGTNLETLVERLVKERGEIREQRVALAADRKTLHRLSVVQVCNAILGVVFIAAWLLVYLCYDILWWIPGIFWLLPFLVLLGSYLWHLGPSGRIKNAKW
jgi:hypothetical protein